MLFDRLQADGRRQPVDARQLRQIVAKQFVEMFDRTRIDAQQIVAIARGGVAFDDRRMRERRRLERRPCDAEGLRRFKDHERGLGLLFDELSTWIGLRLYAIVARRLKTQGKLAPMSVHYSTVGSVDHFARHDVGLAEFAGYVHNDFEEKVKSARVWGSGAFDGHTSGLAERHVQGNVVILPAAWAGEFRAYCEANPRACPLLAVSEPGDPLLPMLGEGIDIRHDLPRYRVWRHGELMAEPTDIARLWRDDLVSFVIGCSFSFEQALREEGLPLRHIDEGRNVAMFRTNVATTPVGAFSGPMVVSMRPFTADDAIRAFEITARYPRAHGAPVHMGDPSIIGITDLQRPDYGDAVTVTSEWGRIEATVLVDETLRSGVVAMTHGWGNERTPGLRVASRFPGVTVDEVRAKTTAHYTE